MYCEHTEDSFFRRLAPRAEGAPVAPPAAKVEAVIESLRAKVCPTPLAGANPATALHAPPEAHHTAAPPQADDAVKALTPPAVVPPLPTRQQRSLRPPRTTPRLSLLATRTPLPRWQKTPPRLLPLPRLR